MARIVLADNFSSYSTLQAVADYFKKLGHEVSIFRDGSQARPILESVTPDVLLISTILPYFDGIQILEMMN